ncbi:family 1 glycosylhydrolase [Streptomyces thermolilacinus]|uniref:family 1 glycosylhydrolase n=1 Tax=Streptomyces thermolilacinus TaxID=285540 RepID=UPI0033FEF4C1
MVVAELAHHEGEFAGGEAYSRRFGLVHVDFPTGRRTPKASCHWYRSLIAERRSGR